MQRVPGKCKTEGCPKLDMGDGYMGSVPPCGAAPGT